MALGSVGAPSHGSLRRRRPRDHLRRHPGRGRAIRATAVVEGCASSSSSFEGRRWDLDVVDPLYVEARDGDTDVGGLRAPMPGKVIAHIAGEGARVEKGAPLIGPRGHEDGADDFGAAGRRSSSASSTPSASRSAKAPSSLRSRKRRRRHEHRAYRRGRSSRRPAEREESRSRPRRSSSSSIASRLTGLTEIEATSFVSPALGPADGRPRRHHARPCPSSRAQVPGPRSEPEGLPERPSPRAHARLRCSPRPPSRSRARTSTARSTSRSHASRPSSKPRRADGVAVRGYVSCVVGCPYEGFVPPERAADVAARARMRCGCFEISLGDTIGVGTPASVRRLLEKVAQHVPLEPRSRALPRHATEWPRRTSYASYEARRAAPSTARSAVSAAARTPRARPATWRPKIVVYLMQGLGVDTGSRSRRARRHRSSGSAKSWVARSSLESRARCSPSVPTLPAADAHATYSNAASRVSSRRTAASSHTRAGPQRRRTSRHRGMRALTQGATQTHRAERNPGSVGGAGSAKLYPSRAR